MDRIKIILSKSEILLITYHQLASSNFTSIETTLNKYNFLEKINDKDLPYLDKDEILELRNTR